MMRPNMRRVAELLLFAFLAAGCEEGQPGLADMGPFLEEVLAAEGCDTSPVLDLSLQIASELACMMGPVLAPLNFDGNLVAIDAAVLPYLAPAAKADLEAAAQNQIIIVNSGFRTVAQQFLLYQWWREGLCGIATASSPGTSNHESARAVDVENHMEARPALEARGFYQTVPGDSVHFDHLASPDLGGANVAAFQRLWNRNHPDEPLSEDGLYGPDTESKLLRAPIQGFAQGACSTP
jgi:hypothetical protein